MHRTNLVGGQGLAEQVNRRHLAAEHTFLVQLRRRSYVALVEGLETIRGRVRVK